ncbi:hypothetical protein EYF80_061563 [Liparis tanakae]|uniref:Uncharacterized protein n=1 Tax=Liparis tanakae TaxID=230148 RepID=A0A4Z2EHJ1_9TELE|nr:hypothetical protein EYF80_061563 [Liparis tanakae]
MLASSSDAARSPGAVPLGESRSRSFRIAEAMPSALGPSEWLSELCLLDFPQTARFPSTDRFPSLNQKPCRWEAFQSRERSLFFSRLNRVRQATAFLNHARRQDGRSASISPALWSPRGEERLASDKKPDWAR